MSHFDVVLIDYYHTGPVSNITYPVNVNCFAVFFWKGENSINRTSNRAGEISLYLLIVGKNQPVRKEEKEGKDLFLRIAQK